MKRSSREGRRRQSLERENEELKNHVKMLEARLMRTMTTTSSSRDSNAEASSPFSLPSPDARQRRSSNRDNVRVITPRKSLQDSDFFQPDLPSKKNIPQGWESIYDVLNEAEYAGWLINPKHLKILDEIGKGSEGTVFKAKWEGASIVVKKMGLRNKKQAKALLRSAEISAKLRHPNVLPLLGAHFNPYGDSYLMFPMMLFGTMKQWLYNDLEKGGVSALFGGATKSKAHDYKKRLKAAWDVVKGMCYLEDMSIMHRDLKPSNIFMKSSAKGCAVIADFGLARYSPLKDNESTPTACTGTFIYMAPEVIVGKWYDTKCDVYSFGILLNELLDLKAPYSGLYYSPQQIAQAVVDQDMRPKMYSNENSQDTKRLQKLVEKCWDKNPNKRPTFSEIRNEMDVMMPRLEVADSPEAFPGTGDCYDNGRESSESRSSREESTGPHNNPVLGSLNKVLEAFF